MRRWRYDDPAKVKEPIQWPVPSEREVQDIIRMLLRSAFDDVVDEEPLRKVGHSSYRSDFGLPRLGLLIEIKYVRSATARVCLNAHMTLALGGPADSNEDASWSDTGS